MLDHLNANNLLDPHQSAYKTGHSTGTALLKVVNDLLTTLDNGKMSIMSLLDFYSAFDVTDHRSLLSRLKSSHAICGTALAWFRSYLINRSQTVSAKGLYSPSTLLKYGVPQGSVLGRYCLSCIPNLCELSSIAALCCMNVSQMMHRKTSSQVSDLRQMIATTQDCISDLKSWMTQNKFQENEDKTELLLAILSRFRNHLQLPSSLCLNGTNISSSFLIRSLGVTLDPVLIFREHISNICKTAYFELRRSVQSVSPSLLMPQTHSCVPFLCPGLITETLFQLDPQSIFSGNFRKSKTSQPG